MNRIRFRSKAALYNGKINGPKQPKKSGSDEAGWKGVRAGLNVSKTIASLKARLRCALGLSPGRNRRLTGDSTGESGAAVSLPPILKESQYSDNGCILDISTASFLTSGSGVSGKVRGSQCREDQQRQLSQLRRMSPAFPESSRAEGNEDTNREHRCIALRGTSGLVEKRANSGILLVDEIPKNGRLVSEQLSKR